MKLTDLLNESDLFGAQDEQPEDPDNPEGQVEQQLTREQKKQILGMVSEYNKYSKFFQTEQSLREIATNLSQICEGAHKFVIDEADDWFDEVTINRNMKDLQKLSEEFAKSATEGHSVQQRLHALYEDMGVILNRYFEIAEEVQKDPTIHESLQEKVVNLGGGFLHGNFKLSPTAQKKTEKLINSLSGEAKAFAENVYKLVKERGTNPSNAIYALRNAYDWRMMDKLRDPLKKALYESVKKTRSGPNLTEDVIQEIKVGNYDIGMGYMGNGLTIWDRNREEHGDYKKIAHVDSHGNLKVYDKSLPSNVRKFLDKVAREEKEKLGESILRSRESVVEHYLEERSEQSLAQTLPEVPAPRSMKILDGPHKGDHIPVGTSSWTEKDPKTGKWCEYRMNKAKTGFTLYYCG